MSAGAVVKVGRSGRNAALMSSAPDNPASLRDARAQSRQTWSIAAGKTYDEQFGSKFSQKHLGPLRQCKQTDASDLFRSFFDSGLVDRIEVAFIPT